MASKPGIFYDWPWAPLGNLKYVVLAPWVIHYTYSYKVKDASERNLPMFLIFPFLLSRIIHNQIWISLSRYRTAKGNNRIVDKSIEFEQIDRERNWDDNIIFNGIILYVVAMFGKTASMPFWRTDHHNFAACWSCGISLLLAPQSIAPPLPLLPLPSTPPCLNCHRAHYM
ncbi:hypothetical protein ACH5RR_023650 [Cinchona calisaya]|uniref:Uncharacterized protein n=1 Tax=Cinchona calisaya TaxID=153742 RepID=A0ABD2ZBC0_9GENT